MAPRPRAQARLQQLGDAEVEELHRAIGGDENVVGFEIAMDDQMLMRVAHGRTHIAKQPQALANGQFPLLAIPVERFALDQIHDQIGKPFLCGAAVDQPSDVRVIELRENLPLRAHPLQDEARRVARGHQLDGDFFFVLRIDAPGAIHLAHATGADQREDLVRADAPADPALAPIIRCHTLSLARLFLMYCSRMRRLLAILTAALVLAAPAYPVPKDGRIAVLEFELNDLTLDPGNAAERERTASIKPTLEKALVQAKKVTVPVEDAAQSAADEGVGYLFDHADAAAALGRAAGADWVVVGRVHKASFLFVYLKAHVVNVATGEQVADLVVEVKGPQKALTARGVESLAGQIVEAIDGAAK